MRRCRDCYNCVSDITISQNVLETKITDLPYVKCKKSHFVRPKVATKNIYLTANTFDIFLAPDCPDYIGDEDE